MKENALISTQTDLNPSESRVINYLETLTTEILSLRLEIFVRNLKENFFLFTRIKLKKSINHATSEKFLIYMKIFHVIQDGISFGRAISYGKLFITIY